MKYFITSDLIINEKSYSIILNDKGKISVDGVFEGYKHSSNRGKELFDTLVFLLGELELVDVIDLRDNFKSKKGYTKFTYLDIIEDLQYFKNLTLKVVKKKWYKERIENLIDNIRLMTSDYFHSYFIKKLQKNSTKNKELLKQYGY